jgi:hypothetical protein
MPDQEKQTAIVFFPKSDRLITQDGYILTVKGEAIEKEFAEMGGSTSTDEYDFNIDEFPKTKQAGIYVWEGTVGEVDVEWDIRPLRGKWRPAQAHDLQLAGLIPGMTS